MKFVFFDIECASVSKSAAKICAFGYCLADENLSLLEKRDILVNPQGGFHLMDRKGGKGLVLPYDYRAFKNAPLFPAVYPQIAALLSGDNVVVGHSIMNDVRYLNLEVKRFSLPPLAFDFYDSQFIYMNRADSFHNQTGLEKIAGELGVRYTAHRAADDSFATLEIVRALCREENADFFSLMQKYHIRAGRTENGNAVSCTSVRYENYLKQQRKEREQRARADALFCGFVKQADKTRPSGELEGNIFSFSKRIEEKLSVSRDYVGKIYEKGGRYSLRADGCNVYVKEEEEHSERLKSALKNGAAVILERELAEWLK